MGSEELWARPAFPELAGTTGEKFCWPRGLCRCSLGLSPLDKTSQGPQPPGRGEPTSAALWGIPLTLELKGSQKSHPERVSFQVQALQGTSPRLGGADSRNSLMCLTRERTCSRASVLRAQQALHPQRPGQGKDMSAPFSFHPPRGVRSG